MSSRRLGVVHFRHLGLAGDPDPCAEPRRLERQRNWDRSAAAGRVHRTGTFESPLFRVEGGVKE